MEKNNNQAITLIQKKQADGFPGKYDCDSGNDNNIIIFPRGKTVELDYDDPEDFLTGMLIW